MSGEDEIVLLTQIVSLEPVGPELFDGPNQPSHVGGTPGRLLAIAPTRVEGVQVFIDCRIDPGALDFFCGNLP
jgi:hypothetical protein